MDYDFIPTAVFCQPTIGTVGFTEEAAREMLAGWAAGRFEIHFPKRFTRFLKALSHLGDGPYFHAIRRVTGL